MKVKKIGAEKMKARQSLSSAEAAASERSDPPEEEEEEEEEEGYDSESQP